MGNRPRRTSTRIEITLWRRRTLVVRHVPPSEVARQGTERSIVRRWLSKWIGRAR